MSISRLSAITAALTATLAAADLSAYRGFHFGSSPEVCAKAAGPAAGAPSVLHSRPARIVEIEWSPSNGQPYPAQSDSVRDATLRFFNGQLFQIVATYDRTRVTGMSPEDMTEAISAAYGAPTKPKAEIPYHSNYGEAAPVIARWQDPGYTYDLVRTGDQTSYALVATARRLDALAQSAIAEARRLDSIEAPQRELDIQASKTAAENIVLEKARAVNRESFRP